MTTVLFTLFCITVCICFTSLLVAVLLTSEARTKIENDDLNEAIAHALYCYDYSHLSLEEKSDLLLENAVIYFKKVHKYKIKQETCRVATTHIDK